MGLQLFITFMPIVLLISIVSMIIGYKYRKHTEEFAIQKQSEEVKQ